MARKNQKLINYHTSSKTAMPSGSSVDYGEIVVRHNAETPELLIKIGEDSFGVFQASGAVQTAINTAVSAAQSTLNTSISNLEKSLSGHVADFEQFQTDVQDTYATKEELEATSGSIITAYTTAIGSLASDLNELSGVVSSITENYVTNSTLNTKVSELEGKISSAKTEAIGKASGYTDTQIAAAKKEVYDSATTFATSAVTVAKGELNSAINAVASNVETLSGAVSSITENYVTNSTLNTTVETLEGKISSAKTEAIGKASGYTDTQIAAAKEYSDGKLSAATDSLKQTIKTLDEKVDTLSGNVETAIDNLESTLTETINNKVAVAYRYQGTVTNYADLPKNLTSGETGYVYNVENANGHIPAGTNYAWNGTEWDALGGIVDLSPYATSASVKTEIDGIKQTTTNLQSAIDSVSSATKTLVSDVSAATVATYATKEELKSTSGSIITAYTQAVADAKLEAIGTASGYTDTQVSAAKDSVYSSATTAAATDATTKANKAKEDAIAAAAASADTLNTSIKAVKTTADNAVQTASIMDSDSKVSVSKVDTELKFDFSNLVIDCGEFN